MYLLLNKKTLGTTTKATRSKHHFKMNSLKTIVLNSQSIKCVDHNNELQVNTQQISELPKTDQRTR